MSLSCPMPRTPVFSSRCRQCRYACWDAQPPTRLPLSWRYASQPDLPSLPVCRYQYVCRWTRRISRYARQTFFERRATNFLGSTTIKTGSNYQKSWNQLPEKLEATTRKVGINYQKSWKHLPENLEATHFLGYHFFW